MGSNYKRRRPNRRRRGSNHKSSAPTHPYLRKIGLYVGAGIITVALATVLRITRLQDYEGIPKIPPVHPNSLGATSSVIGIPLDELVANTDLQSQYFKPKKVDHNFPPLLRQVEQDIIKNIKTTGRFFGQKTFELRRGIARYVGILHAGFIQKLPHAQHWIDMGCGHAVAPAEYRIGRLVSKNPYWIDKGLEGYLQTALDKAMQEDHSLKARVTGVRYEKVPEVPIPYNLGITIFEGRLLEDIPNSELTSEYGKADIITDVFGPITYSPRVDLIISKYLALLRRGGAFYTILPNNGDDIENYVYTPTGKAVYLGKWIESLDNIPGLSVSSIQTPIADTSSLEIVKEWGGVIGMPSLRLLSVRKTASPSRVYEQIQTGCYVVSSSSSQHASFKQTEASSPTYLADCRMSSVMNYGEIDKSRIEVSISDFEQMEKGSTYLSSGTGKDSTFYVGNTTENIRFLDSLMKPRMRIQQFSIDRNSSGKTATLRDITVAEFSKNGGFLKSTYLQLN